MQGPPNASSHISMYAQQPPTVGCAGQAQAEAVSLQQQEAVEGFQALLATGSLLRSRIRSFIHAPDKALPFLQEGRLVQLLAASQPSSGQYGFWVAAPGIVIPALGFSWTISWTVVMQEHAMGEPLCAAQLHQDDACACMHCHHSESPLYEDTKHLNPGP